ncbi:MAG TPA: ATP-binding protein [Mobilitalea sp.]|nr:ATP-binding protein [Mobilitalea sp.]
MDYSAICMPAITLFTAQLTVLDLGEFRYRPKKLFLILAFEFVFQVSVCSSILLSFGFDIYAKCFFIIMDIPAFLTFFYISKRRDLRDLFTIIVTIFLNFSISVPSKELSDMMEEGYSWFNISRVIIFALLFYFLHTQVRDRYKLLQEEIEKGWGIYSILPLLGSGALYYKYYAYSQNGDFSDVFFDCMVIILILAAVFLVINYFFDQLHEKYLIQEQKRILSMQNKAQYDQFEQFKEDAEKTNRRWHDMRHNMQELIELLEAGNTDQALSYLKGQRGMLEVPKEEYCMHPAVNSILCLWVERSRKAQIAVEIKTDVPEILSIEPMELSALFANAFENAHNACLRLPNSEHRFIKVEAHYNGKRLAIGFANSCSEDIHFEKDIPVSTKIGGGIGTRSITYTVQRYHGTAYFGAKDNVFTARFVLNI